MQKHIVSAFEKELKNLGSKISKMGGLAENQLSMAIKALETNDFELAQKTIKSDKEIDKLELEIEEEAILIIAKRQPMALDLRRVIVTIRISADLERIGDLAKNIAKRVIAIDGQTPKSLITGFHAMSEMAQKLLKDVLDAFADENVDQAVEVWRRDEDLDAIYNSIFRELLTYMMEDTRNISFSTHLLFGAKNIERIGDHATNIAENIHYMVTGQLMAEDRPKSDNTSTSKFDFDESADI
ncbi:MAG: phosphate signaling complex protein PhoU [Hyphomicrobiales bacterium]